MLPLAERVYRTIQRDRLIPPDARVVAAVSGGADSTALVLLLAELAPRAALTVASLAHYNHRLRGPESDADEAACAALARRLGLPFDAGGGDVRAAARRWHTSVEDAGRRLRYEFLQGVAARRGAGRIAVGHTRDDQAETVLLHLLRGTGARGRAGMAARRGPVVRPLIDCRHRELVAWLGERGEEFREDRSNQDRRHLRNRVRLELIPFLEERFSAAVVEVLARGAGLAAQEAEFLDEAARQLGERAVSETGASVTIDAAVLGEAPRVVASRVARDAIERLAGGRPVGWHHATALVDLALGSDGRRLNLPGQVATRRVGTVQLEAGGCGPHRRRNRAAGAVSTGIDAQSSPAGILEPNSFVQKLSIPGEVLVAGTGTIVSAELADRGGEPSGDWRDLPRGPATVAVDAGAAGPLGVRTRRPGDRLWPLGAPGSRKLQDYLVDRKVPREERDSLPLVVAADGRIVWVAGVGIGEEFRVRGDTRAVVILKMRGDFA